MKILYLINLDTTKNDYIGIVNKINGQLAAFKNNNVVTSIHNFRQNNRKTLVSKVIKRIWLFSPNDTKYTDNVNYKDYDCIYIRHAPLDYYFIKLLKKIRKENNFAKIFMEIPTYPYDKEYDSLSKKFILIKDKFFRYFLKYYISKVVTFSSDRKIYDIETINISNGIEIEKNPVKKFIEFNTELDVLCLANVSFWHGYDRFIKGMYVYYKTKNKIKVNLHIVGDGEEILNLKKLTKQLNLEKYVCFWGVKKGNELNEIFNKCHIAIDHLGLHRKGLTELSSLKSKEYCARGIPFILAHNDKVFNNKEYAHKVLGNEEPININEIIKFSETFVNNLISKEMRKYAEKFSWDFIIKILLSKI